MGNTLQMLWVCRELDKKQAHHLLTSLFIHLTSFNFDNNSARMAIALEENDAMGKYGL